MATDKLVDFDHVTDYISRQAALNAVCSDDCEDCPDGGCDMYRRLKRLRAADVRPVVLGKWIPSGNWNGGTGFYRCSICKDDVFMDEGLPTNSGFFFCPHCGADMREATP